MPWHKISDGQPEIGETVVLVGRRGGMYLGSRKKYPGGGDYYYVPNRRDAFLDAKQVVAWHEIEPWDPHAED